MTSHRQFRDKAGNTNSVTASSNADPGEVAEQVIAEARAMMVAGGHSVQEIDDFLTAGLGDAKALALVQLSRAGGPDA